MNFGALLSAKIRQDLYVDNFDRPRSEEGGVHELYEYFYSNRFPTRQNLLFIPGHGVVYAEYGEPVTQSRGYIYDCKSGSPPKRTGRAWGLQIRVD